MNPESHDAPSKGPHDLSNDVLGQRERSILFCTTNGVGLGHLTRALAVARSLAALDAAVRITFLISTPDLSMARKEGYPTYYVPYFTEVESVISWESWHKFVCTTALCIFENHNVGTIVFDGYRPYPGLLTALDKRRDVCRVWIRRGLQKQECDIIPDQIEDEFQYVIRPLEAGDTPVPFDGKSYAVDPILSFDMSSLLGREAARKKLCIPPDALAVYVQLGAGVKISNTLVLTETVRALNESGDLFVILAISALSYAEVPELTNGHVIRNYPNFPILSAFDFAISATGYNSVHELLACRIPTILVPHESEMSSEDVFERAMRVERAGAAIVVRAVEGREQFRQGIRTAIDRLRDATEREKASSAAGRLFTGAGTLSAAMFISEVHRLKGRVLPGRSRPRNERQE